MHLSGIQVLFYALYVLGFFLAGGFSFRYHVLTHGAWKTHQTGISFMGMAIALAVTFFDVVIRVLALQVFRWTWADTPTLYVALTGLFMVCAFLAHRWFLLERYQNREEDDR